MIIVTTGELIHECVSWEYLPTVGGINTRSRSSWLCSEDPTQANRVKDFSLSRDEILALDMVPIGPLRPYY